MTDQSTRQDGRLTTDSTQIFVNKLKYGDEFQSGTRNQDGLSGATWLPANLPGDVYYRPVPCA